MRLHYLQHVSYEDLGAIADWANQREATLTATRFFESDWQFPAIDEIEYLLVLGGPMSVHDEASCEWLSHEKKFIMDFLATGKPILGICLGAQLLAQALGANVYRSEWTEIGWWPIQTSHHAECTEFLPRVANELLTFHWHGDTFDLPDRALRLASSGACLQQAFLYADHVLGLQFHLEATAQTIADMTLEAQHELRTEQRWVQSATQLQVGVTEHEQANRQVLYTLLDRFYK